MTQQQELQIRRIMERFPFKLASTCSGIAEDKIREEASLGLAWCASRGRDATWARVYLRAGISTEGELWLEFILWRSRGRGGSHERTEGLQSPDAPRGPGHGDSDVHQR